MAMGHLRTRGWQWHLARPWRAGRLFAVALVVNVGVVALLVMLSTRLGFAPASVTAPQGAPPGFLWGLWHGLVLPIAVVASFFRPSVGLYAPVHDGHAYDAGFLIGAAAILHWPFARVTSTVHHPTPGPELRRSPYGDPQWPPSLLPDEGNESPSRTWSPPGPGGPHT